MQYFLGLETSESRGQTIAALERQQVGDPTNLIIAHTLGLMYYWAAIQAETPPQRFTLLKGMIPNWAVVLESGDYWKQWCAERQSIYGEPIGDTVVQKACEALKERILRSLAETTPDLVDAFHLESKAIQLSRQARTSTRTEKRPLWCGPLMVRRLGLEAEVGKFFGQSYIIEESPEFLNKFHQIFAQEDLVSDQPASDSQEQRQLMQCFSQLAYPALYIDQGHPERALEALTQFNCTECAGYLPPGNTSRNVPLPRTCAENCPRFSSLNPAYARLPHRGNVLWQHAIDLTAEAHMRLAEQRLAAASLDASAAIQHWQDAVEVASAGSGPRRLKGAITDMAQSRATALDRNGRLDDAILLLEAAQAFDKTRRLSGKQAELLTDRGIKAGNAGQWENAVADLRRALSLNLHLPRTRRNLVVALQNGAEYCSRVNNGAQARAWLEEAVQVLEATVKSDPQDEEAQRQLLETRAALSMLGGPTETTVDPFELLREILGTSSSLGSEQVSQPAPAGREPGQDLAYASHPGLENEPLQSAAAQAKRKDYAGAIAILEEALRRSLEDQDLKNALVGIMEEYADTLLSKRQFSEAASVVARGLSYAPDHVGLRSTLAAIRMFQPHAGTKA